MTRIALIVSAFAVLTTALVGVDTAAAGLPYSQRAGCTAWVDAGGFGIVVSSPEMAPLSNNAVISNGNITTATFQWVGYQVTIARWNGQYGYWQRYRTGPLLQQRVSSNEHASTQLQPWFNVNLNRWEYPATTYWVEPGYYKVWIDYYWYADQYNGSAHTAGYYKWDYANDLVCHF